jgi:hypothetical protein
MDFVPLYRGILIGFQLQELPGTFVPDPAYFCNPRDVLIRAHVETESGS